MRGMLAAAFALGNLLVARPLVAQLWRSAELGAGATAARFRSTVAGNAGASSGVVASGEARLVLGPLSLRGWYSQGHLAPDTGSTPTSDMAEAGLLVAVHPTPWATLAAGPRLRAYVLPAGTERWTLWEGSVRLEQSIVGAMVRAHLELRAAFSGQVNGASANAVRGGEAGITARRAGSPFWVRLTYAIDHATLQSGGAETLDGVAVTLGLGGR